ARGLETTYAAEPRLVVIDRSNGSSGIVRADYYDWIAELPGILAAVEPDFVVVMIGTNDRQEMRTAAGTERLRAPGWDTEYAARAAAIAAILETHGQPALWVGQPPMRQRSMSADMAFFNSVYEAAIEGVGGIYVDVWDAFADVDGRFTATGPDVEGRVRTLRGDDGFSLTTAGRVKLAYYVDREIRLPGAGDAVVFLADPQPGNRPEVLPDGTRQLVGPVIAFAQPPPGAPTELLDRAPVIVSGTAQYRLLVRGESLPPVTGRADDFRWPRPTFAPDDPAPAPVAADPAAAEPPPAP
ncbi:MAG: SGNH/GDSL hydrolase family protein, partial [Bauldia sp.]